MDTINAKILEIRNDHENVFHVTLDVHIPDGVALIRIEPSALRNDLVINFRSRQPTDPRHLVGTTVGRPAFYGRRHFSGPSLLRQRGRSDGWSDCADFWDR